MLDDIRFAFRQLRKTPGFTFLAVINRSDCHPGYRGRARVSIPRGATLVRPIQALRSG
jgi:hypothetical protein